MNEMVDLHPNRSSTQRSQSYRERIKRKGGTFVHIGLTRRGRAAMRRLQRENGYSQSDAVNEALSALSPPAKRKRK